MTLDHRLISFMVDAPDLLRCLLHRYRRAPWLQPSDGVKEWGVGQYMSGDVVLRTTPGALRTAVHPADLLRAKSRSSLLIAQASLSVAPTHGLEDIQPFRFRRYLFAMQGAFDLGERREKFFNELPRFLQRARKGRLDGELLFLHFMANVYSRGMFDREIEPETLASFLHQVAQVVETPIDILATNGEVLLAYRSSGPLQYCLFEGMDDCELCRISAQETRIKPVVESHQRFKGICVASRPFETPEPWFEVPDRKVLIIDPSIDVRCAGVGGSADAKARGTG